MKKFFGKFGLALLLSAMATTMVYAAKLNAVIAEEGRTVKTVMNTVDIKVNGKLLEGLTMPPVIYNDYTLAPVKEVFEALGATVIWNPDTEETYVIVNNNVAILEKNSNIANINAKDVAMPVDVKNINNKTMVQVAFLSEALGMSVSWDSVNKVVSIDSTTGGAQQPQDNYETAPGGDEPPVMSDTPPAPPAAAQTTDTNQNMNTSQNMNTNQNVSTNQNMNTSQNINISPTGSTNQNAPVDVSDGVIVPTSYPTASIKNIVAPSASGDLIFQIQAATPISSLNYFIQPDPYRLVIDIANSSLDTPKTSYEITGNSVCQSVRMSQYTLEPEKSSRIVFDLSASPHYKVALSPDRKTITVQFLENKISDVQFQSDGTSDYVIITGQWSPAVSLFPLSDPSRLVADLPNSLMSVVKNEYVSGIYTEAIRTGQFEEDTGRVVLSIKSHSSWQISYEGNRSIIKVSAPTYRNLDFDAAANQLSIKKTGDIMAKNIIETDDYSNRRYVLTLPGDYSSVYGKGEYYINSDKVSSVSIDSTTGNTRFVINERSIYAAIITEDADYIYVKMVNPKQKYSKVVLIDPGHGKDDPGTSGYGMIEKDLDLDISLRIVKIFEADPTIKLYSTRIADTYPTLEERAYLANEMADLFVSVHNNYFEGNASANGTEVFYYQHANDASVGFTSKQVADIIHRHIITELGSYDRKVKPTKYVVLNLTTVPAVLCEIGFLSNYDEAMKLSTDEYRQAAAAAVSNGIKEVFASYTPKR